MPERLCERKIFVSSTIGNLREERQVVQERLRKPFDHVRFHAVFSENPETLHMSGDDLKTYVGDNPNLFILNQIKYADYFMLLLNDQYYGEKNIRDLGNIRGHCEEELQTERVLNYLNYERRPLVHFTKVDDIKTAKYVLLTIGRKCMDNISAAAECQAMLCGKAHIIILVRQDIFESYEKYCRSPQAEETSESYAYQMIQVFNESKDKRKWIYTYSSVEEIVNIVGNIILAEYFEIDFVKPIVTMKPNEYFQNTLIFRNEGYVELTGYYIDGFFIHNVGKHRPKLRNFNPVMKKADPFEELHINMDFKAPDIAGSFIFYIIVKKMGRILKMEDSIRSFTIHVRSFNESGLYDAVLLEEHPGNGKLYTQKDDFKKIWRLKNVSGEDWKKVVFKVRYEHLTHYFCKERKKVLGPIPNGSEFTLDAMFHPPDIPGKYTAFWQLLRADGTEIIIDGPLCCSVVTQYETQSLFEVCFP